MTVDFVSTCRHSQKHTSWPKQPVIFFFVRLRFFSKWYSHGVHQVFESPCFVSFSHFQKVALRHRSGACNGVGVFNEVRTRQKALHANTTTRREHSSTFPENLAQSQARTPAAPGCGRLPALGEMSASGLREFPPRAQSRSCRAGRWSVAPQQGPGRDQPCPLALPSRLPTPPPARREPRVSRPPLPSRDTVCPLSECGLSARSHQLVCRSRPTRALAPPRHTKETCGSSAPAPVGHRNAPSPSPAGSGSRTEAPTAGPRPPSSRGTHTVHSWDRVDRPAPHEPLGKVSPRPPTAPTKAAPG